MESTRSITHFKVKNPDEHSLDHLKFVFYQAEKRLDESNKVFDATTTKTVMLITLSVALLSTLSAYFFVNNDMEGTYDPRLFTVFLLCIYTLSTIYYLIRNIAPYDYHPMGSYPRDLLTEKPANNTEEIHLKDIYYSELFNYDARIVYNSQVNTERLNRFNVGLYLLTCAPVIGLLIYLISSYLA